MNRGRRRVLSALGTMSVVALAGCSGSEDGGSVTPTDSGDDDDTEEEPETDTPTEEETDRPTPYQQQTKLTADDGDAEDGFGGAVAIADDGSTALVAAESDEDPNGENAGSAYVFARSGGSWQQQTKLTPDDGDDGDGFGYAVAMAADGRTAVVGARRDEDPNGERAGAAYVFAQSDSGWQQAAKLTDDDGNRFDEFGFAVAMTDDGSTVLVGARYKEEPNGEAAGAASVFSRSGGDWQQETRLAADDGDSEDEFGYSVAMAGDGSRAIVGARGDENPHGAGAGSAYVFERSGSEWEQAAKLAAEDGDSEDDFGEGVAMAGDGSTAIVGADSEEDPNGEDAGAAYVFARSGGSWQQEVKLTPDDGDEGDDFGEVIAMTDDGGTAVIGADSDEDPNGEDAGSAYVFTRSESEWQQAAKLAAEDGDAEDSFGGAIAVTGDGSTALIGADSDEDPNGAGAGSAYVLQ